MARVWVDSFENARLTNYGGGSSYGIVSSSLGPGGRYALQLGYLWGSWLRLFLPQDYSEIYMMFRYVYGGYRDEPSSRFLYLIDSNGTVGGILSNNTPNRVVKSYRGDGVTELSTGTTSVNPNVGYRIEFHYKPHDTNGVFQVKIDGKLELDYSGDTTVGLPNISAIQFYQNGYSGAVFDDIIIDDTNWVGNSTIKIIVPDGPGDVQQWKSSIGDYDTFSKLLLHFDGDITDSSQSAVTVYNSSTITFLDTSPVTKTITPYGNVRLVATESKFGGTSAYFDGSGDYLKPTYTSDFAFGTNNFTMAAWVYLNAMPTSDSWPTNWGSHMSVMGVGTPGTGDGCTLVLGATRIILHSNNSQFLYGSHGITTGGWHHIAAVRSGNNFYLFVDGVQKATKSSTSAMGSGSGFYIGCETGEGAWFNGYMDDLVVSSSALWTANFTPPTEAYIADENTKLLCSFDFPENSPTFSNAEAKFGEYSMYFSGSLGYLSATAGSNFAIGTNKFAIDCWVRSTFLGPELRSIYDTRATNSDSSDGFSIGLKNSKLVFHSNGLDRITGTTTFLENTWYHIAVVGNKQSIKMYVNGVQDGGTYIITYNFTQNTPTIGANNNRNDNFWNGYIDEFRLSIGTFRWYYDFTPSTTAYTNHNDDNNWSTVDEVPANDSDYIFADTIGMTDTYTMQTLGSTAHKIKSVTMTARAKQLGDAEVNNIQFVCRHQGIDYLSDPVYVPESPEVETKYTWDNCPATTEAWTKESFAACQFGVKAVE